jgi:hypothetical protein
MRIFLSSCLIILRFPGTDLPLRVARMDKPDTTQLDTAQYERSIQNLTCVENERKSVETFRHSVGSL